MELTTNNQELIKNKLSILIAQDGFSFCTGNKETHTIIAFKHKSFLSKQTPEDLLKEIKTVLEFSFRQEDKIDELEVFYSNTLYTLVPDAFFKEKNLTDYLKYNTKILATDYITFDHVEAVHAKNVYIPYTNINNYLFEKFGEFSFKHISSTLLELFRQEDTKDKVLLNVYSSHFHVVVFKNGQLHLANSFEYQTKEDFIYYVLFVLEQLELDPLKAPVFICGEIDEQDAHYKMLTAYIQHIDFFALRTSTVSLSEDLTIDHQHNNLLISQF